MTRFRAALRAEIDSRLEVLNGNPPAEAIAYKKRVMRLFVSHGSAVATRRALLALCPNGEWRAPKVQYYVRSSTSQPRSRAAILEHVTSGVMVALASAQPALYNRSKWTGCDLAVDDLRVFEAVHRLFEHDLLPLLRQLCEWPQGNATSRAWQTVGALQRSRRAEHHRGRGARCRWERGGS